MATYSLYQARQFSLKSRWVLYPWQNVSSFLFFTIIFQYENWFAIFFLRDPNSLGRKRPRASFRSWNRRPKSNSWDNTGSRFLETTNFFHFKGGPGNWSVPPREREIRIRDKNNSAMFSRPLRVIHRESMCIERIIVSEMKILSIYYCYLRATLYAWIWLWLKIAEPILLGKWTRFRDEDWNIISLWGSYVDLFASFTIRQEIIRI